MTDVTPELLRELLDYDPATGRLFWKERPASMFATARAHSTWNARYAGKEAFTAIGSHGYPTGAIFNKTLLKHRVVWAIAKGDWPPAKLDHKDRNRFNCRIDNLRPASQAANCLNHRGYAADRKTSRFKGVYWNKSTGNWAANFRHKHLGLFADEAEAARAYDRAACAFDPEFAYLNSAVGG